MSDRENDPDNLIRELREELEHLKDEKEKFRLIAEFTNDFEYWMDPKGKFKYISPGCRNISGYAPETILGQQELFEQLVHPEDLIKVNNYLSRCLDLTLINETITFRLITRSKLIKQCEISSKAVYDPIGKYLGQRGTIRDISKLTDTLRQVKDISEGRTWEEKAKNRFKELAEKRDRELTSSLVQMSQKNELLHHIARKLGKLNPTNPEGREIIRDIQNKIRQEVSNTDIWEEFRLHFENNHPGFFSRLSSRYPRLTSKDMKLCAYLRLQLSTKEIAGLLNITPKSAEISRVRLRKKLGIERSVDLTIFINRI